MGDHESGGTLAPVAQLIERRFDFRLGCVVEIGRGFVENENARLVHQHAGDLQTLPFAHGKSHTAFADFGVEPVRQAIERAREAGSDGGLAHLGVRSIGALVPDVVRQRAREYRAVRGHHPDGAPDRSRIESGERLAIHSDLAGVRFPELQQQVGRRSLACPRGPGQGRQPGWLDGEAQAVQDFPPGRIAEADIAEFHLSGPVLQQSAARFLRAGLKQLDGAAERSQMLLETHRYAAQRLDRLEQAVQVRHEHHDVPGSEPPLEHQQAAVAQHESLAELAQGRLRQEIAIARTGAAHVVVVGGLRARLQARGLAFLRAGELHGFDRRQGILDSGRDVLPHHVVLAHAGLEAPRRAPRDQEVQREHAE